MRRRAATRWVGELPGTWRESPLEQLALRLACVEDVQRQLQEECGRESSPSSCWDSQWLNPVRSQRAQEPNTRVCTAVPTERAQWRMVEKVSEGSQIIFALSQFLSVISDFIKSEVSATVLSNEARIHAQVGEKWWNASRCCPRKTDGRS